MITAVYAIAATILLLSGLCLMASQPKTAATADEPSRAPTEAVTTNETLTVTVGEPEVIRISQEDEPLLTAWTTTDDGILTVDSGGRIDATAAGTARVTARYSDGRQTVYTVTVKEAEKQKQPDIFTTAITANEDVLERNETGDEPLYRLYVNREQNVVTVYTYGEDGEYDVPVRAMVCSCGQRDSMTIDGEFDTYFTSEWHPLFNDVYGRYVTGITGNFLFHSVPYEEWLENDSLETEEFNKLGDHASLGCVRLAVSDAKWVMENCGEGTFVKIYDSDKEEPLGKPQAIRIADKSVGWDPTDDDPDNPYRDKTPVIKIDKPLNVRRGADFNIYRGVTAKDTCGNDITGTVTAVGNVVTARPGAYRVTYRVTDALHRSAEETITITVEE